MVDLIEEPEPEYDWAIPKVMEHTDRLIFTGEEGHGKSTLLRQISVQSGSGIHPFTLHPMPPLPTLLLDVENSRNQIRRKSRPLVEAAGLRLPRGRTSVVVRPQGLDLSSSLDRRLVEGWIQKAQPRLLIAGPLYKLMSGNPNEEQVAKPVAEYLDHIRVEYDLTLILEAHSPYASNGGERPKRPYGWSGWSRWPEFGLHIGKDGKLTHWRGPRDEREWPRSLQWGDPWPWVLGEDDRYSAILAACVEIAQMLGYKPVLRELEEKLPFSKSAIGRAIQADQERWDNCLSERPKR